MMPHLEHATASDFPLFASPQSPPKRLGAPVAIDVSAGAEARDAAISRVDRAASPEWKARALGAVRFCCLLNEVFTTDSVWEYLEEKPPEPRAMGPVMRRAEAAGYCSKTESFRPTALVSGHRGPRRIWKSNIYRGDGDG